MKEKISLKENNTGRQEFDPLTGISAKKSGSPQFAENGFLPPGIVDATLQEIEDLVVGANLSKSDLWVRLQQFISEVSVLRSHIVDLFIDGSFISAYPITSDSDIDVLVIVKDHSGAEAMFDFMQNFRPEERGLDIKVSPDDVFPDAQHLHDFFSRINRLKFPDVSGEKGYFRIKL